MWGKRKDSFTLKWCHPMHQPIVYCAKETATWRKAIISADFSMHQDYESVCTE